MKLYNSFTKKVEQFSTINGKEVKMYVCGITPYDTTHLGHAFTYLIFDVVKRYLQYKKFKVNYVQNVTDIDDDILKKAKEEGRDWKDLGNLWTQRFLDDLKWLNILLPDKYVRATDSIGKIIEINKKLFEEKYAYEKNGNLYFEIAKFKNYGKLSKYTKAEMIIISSQRGGDPKDPNKKDPLDFILWQKTKENEPFWESPWGKGRPGWHIECSAMINTNLGDRIDIHGGGFDLIYPHHESEIAQSESYSGKSPFVKYWMHVAMVGFRGEKMSKSLGNLVMVSDLAKKYSANVIRYFLLKHHYRKVWEFEYSELNKSLTEFNKIEASLNNKTSDESMDFSEAEKLIENDLDIPSALDLIPSMSPENARKVLNILGFSI